MDGSMGLFFVVVSRHSFFRNFTMGIYNRTVFYNSRNKTEPKVMRLCKHTYFLVGLSAIVFIYSTINECLHTYRIAQHNGWWRNYISERENGFSGSYDDFIISLYLGDIFDSFLIAMALLVVLLILAIVVKHICKKVNNRLATN